MSLLFAHLLVVHLLIFLSLCSPQTVGVIVRLERENFSVLNQHGKVSNLLRAGSFVYNEFFDFYW